MTLRTRLLIGLLALAAVGLSISAVVTYRQQQDFLIKQFNSRLDSTVRSDDLRQILRRSVRQGQPVTIVSPGGDIVADLHTPFGDGYASTLKDTPDLPDDELGTFTIDSPHYRGFAMEEADGTRYIVALPLRQMDQTLHNLFLVELFVVLGVLTALAGLTWLVIKLGLRPLEQMQVTAGAIAAGDLSKRVEVIDETTEVGKLGLALNEMMNQIENAFDERAASEERLRRFVGDASHELRTPLTSIRGYAELFRRGAADRPEDLAKAMRRIEEEADRMGVLVDDLLLLARLDQGRPLEHNPIDLTRIARDAIDDLRTVAPDRPIDFTAATPVVVPGDDTRLRQVLANLLQNANRHTPAGTAVHVRVFTEGEEAVIEVADEGPGMEPEEAKRVFERFWRSDPARTRASGGAGLGLSIVRAIAEAHGGRATVEATPGEGATFRIYLPRQVDEAKVEEPPTAPAPVPAIPVSELEDATD